MSKQNQSTDTLYTLRSRKTGEVLLVSDPQTRSEVEWELQGVEPLEEKLSGMPPALAEDVRGAVAREASRGVRDLCIRHITPKFMAETLGRLPGFNELDGRARIAERIRIVTTGATFFALENDPNGTQFFGVKCDLEGNLLADNSNWGMYLYVELAGGTLAIVAKSEMARIVAVGVEGNVEAYPIRYLYPERCIEENEGAQSVLAVVPNSPECRPEPSASAATGQLYLASSGNPNVKRFGEFGSGKSALSFSALRAALAKRRTQ